ncbi:MAG: bifunctional heptose 7-phosphate kinase/heptose 1-phosphate adenyltransferase [Planctomycetota bacterium]
MPSLLSLMSSYKPFTAIVIGDFMLDQHVYGAAERLSPDAPVPVLHATKTEDRPGGAANVALCLRALHANVTCFGVVGDDREGDRLRDVLSQAGCDVKGIISDSDRPTTIKRSLIGLAQHRHPQKMFRLDFESKDPIADARQQSLVEHVDAALGQADVVCIEDYDKGVITETTAQAIIERCRSRGIPVLVDPAAIEDYAKYRGATAITPNRTEAERATGLDTPLESTEIHNLELAHRLLKDHAFDAVVLTLDRDGALLELRDGERVHVPTVARHVYDVTGAGDMVLAALAGGIANRFPWREAVEFANAAAGLEVEVFGVQPIPFPRVHREVMALRRPLSGKVRTLDELQVEVAAHRDGGQRIIFTNGCFDVIHAGHVAYLREARQLGDVLIVAVNSDAQVRAQKGDGRPIYNESERLEILSELQCVDYLVLFEEPTVGGLLEALRPDVYVKGGDYAPDEINEYDVVQALGLELRVLAHRPGLGSTQVIERMIRTSDTPG